MIQPFQGIIKTVIALFILNCAVVSACSDEKKPKDPAPLVIRTGLRGNKANANVEVLQQISVASFTENFKTPVFPLYESEFLQSDEHPPAVDILIVVDNSGSMSEEQTNLSTKMKSLIGSLEHTDWHINIITTDSPCSTQAYLPLTASMPEAEAMEKFKTAINVGIMGSSVEKGIEMAVKNISLTSQGSCTPKPWLREKAKFAIIILSDEDENETSTATPDSMVNLLTNKGYTVGKDAKVYAIIFPPGQPCAGGYTEGAKYQELVAKTKGLVGNICATDYSQTLADISEDVSHLIYLEIPLRGEPVKGSVLVTIDDVEFDDGWIVVGDKFILRRPLEPGSHLKVTYKLDDIKTIYLTNKIPIANIKVSIDQKDVPAAAYRYNEDQKQVVFNNSLPEGKEIQITYQENRELLTTYDFPEVPDEIIECYLDNQLIDHRYFLAEKKIVFDPPTPSGAKVYCLYGASGAEPQK